MALSLLLFFFLLPFPPSVEASIHIYNREAFKEIGNAYLLSGGSEGIITAQPAVDAADGNLGLGVGDGSSFIRFETNGMAGVRLTMWESRSASLTDYWEGFFFI